MTITPQLVEKYRQNLAESEKSSATIAKYCHAAEDFMNFLAGKPITKISLLEYRSRLMETKTAATVNGYISAINLFLTFCKLGRFRLKMLRLQRKPFLDESRELTEPEYNRLVAAAKSAGKDRLCLILQTICGTGIRISELPFITVEAATVGQTDVALKGKHRTVLIPKQLRKKLLSYAKSRGVFEGPIFITKGGRPIDRSNIAHEMKNLCVAARVDTTKVFPHNLRHLFARKFYAIEKNLAHLADILGHSSVETTRIYVAVSARRFERTLEKMKLIL